MGLKENWTHSSNTTDGFLCPCPSKSIVEGVKKSSNKKLKRKQEPKQTRKYQVTILPHLASELTIKAVLEQIVMIP